MIFLSGMKELSPCTKLPFSKHENFLSDTLLFSAECKKKIGFVLNRASERNYPINSVSFALNCEDDSDKNVHIENDNDKENLAT